MDIKRAELMLELPYSPETRRRITYSLNNLVDTQGRPTQAAVNTFNSLNQMIQLGGAKDKVLEQVAEGDEYKLGIMLSAMEGAGSVEDAIMIADKTMQQPRKPMSVVTDVFGGTKKYNEYVNRNITTKIMSNMGTTKDNQVVRNQLNMLVNEEMNKLGALGLYNSDKGAISDAVTAAVMSKTVDGIVGYTTEDKGNKTHSTKDMIEFYMSSNKDMLPLKEDDLVTYNNGNYYIHRSGAPGINTTILSDFDISRKWQESPTYRKEKRESELNERRIRAVQEGSSTGSSYYDTTEWWKNKQ
jgi:hypothetical protein